MCVNGELIGTMGGLPNEPTPDLRAPQDEGLQIDDHRLSRSCAVVERPDRHCINGIVTDILGTCMLAKTDNGRLNVLFCTQLTTASSFMRLWANLSKAEP